METGRRRWRRCWRGSGFGASKLTVLEALGGPDERIRRTTAGGFDLENINALNVLALEIESDREARVLPLAAGRADDLFEHDGQITKREVRAVTLAALGPAARRIAVGHRRGFGLDVDRMDAGRPGDAGDCASRANAERAARIRRNAAAFGVPGLTVVEGTAPAALAGPADAGRDLHRRRRHGCRRDGCGDCRPASGRPAGGECGDAGDGGAAAGEACRARRRAGAHRDFARDGDRLDERLATGHAGDAVDVGEAVIVAGIGSRKGVSAAEVVAAVEAALKEHGLERSALDACWRPARDEAGRGRHLRGQRDD